VKYTAKVNFKTTPEQLALIDNVAKNYEKSRAATIRDMISMFILITETDIPLRDVIVAAIPALTDRLIKDDPGTAYAVLNEEVTTDAEM
jgi:isochorismate hydrolase